MIQSVEGIRIPTGVLVVYSMPIQVSGLLNEYKLSVCVFVCVWGGQTLLDKDLLPEKEIFSFKG